MFVNSTHYTTPISSYSWKAALRSHLRATVRGTAIMDDHIDPHLYYDNSPAFSLNVEGRDRLEIGHGRHGSCSGYVNVATERENAEGQPDQGISQDGADTLEAISGTPDATEEPPAGVVLTIRTPATERSGVTAGRTPNHIIKDGREYSLTTGTQRRLPDSGHNKRHSKGSTACTACHQNKVS